MRRSVWVRERLRRVEKFLLAYASQGWRSIGLRMALALAAAIVLPMALVAHYEGWGAAVLFEVVVGWLIVALVWSLVDGWESRGESDGGPSLWNGARLQCPSCGLWFKHGVVFCRRCGSVVDE